MYIYIISLVAFYFAYTANADLRIFFSLNQALKFFRNDSSVLASRILYTFENDCCFTEEPRLPKSRRPFIVIEGNHRKSRNVVGMRLAKLMQGRYLVHPAYCLQKLTNELPKGTLFRRAFYILSMYALSFDVKQKLSLGRSVVVNGYWWDMLTFALVQAFPPERTPDTRDPMFEFPEDLLRPDLVFFLNFPDHLYFKINSTKPPQTWKPRILHMYRELQAKGQPIAVHDLTGVYWQTLDVIYERIFFNLSSHLDVWFDRQRKTELDYHNE